jgi:hypothetical protein
MKFVPLLGEILKDLALKGNTDHDISHFKIDRPGVRKGTYPGRLLSSVAGSHGSSQLLTYEGSRGGH